MEADIGGETMSDLEASAANRDRTVVTAAAERHGQPNGPAEAEGNCDGIGDPISLRCATG